MRHLIKRCLRCSLDCVWHQVWHSLVISILRELKPLDWSNKQSVTRFAHEMISIQSFTQMPLCPHQSLITWSHPVVALSFATTKNHLQQHHLLNVSLVGGEQERICVICSIGHMFGVGFAQSLITCCDCIQLFHSRRRILIANSITCWKWVLLVAGKSGTACYGALVICLVLVSRSQVEHIDLSLCFCYFLRQQRAYSTRLICARAACCRRHNLTLPHSPISLPGSSNIATVSCWLRAVISNCSIVISVVLLGAPFAVWFFAISTA